VKQRKDAASAAHKMAKDVLSRLIEERGWTAEQEVSAPYDASRRELRLDVTATPPRRARPWPKFAFELQAADVRGKEAEVLTALANGLAGYEDIVVIPIGGLTDAMPVAKWRSYLRSYLERLEVVRR